MYNSKKYNDRKGNRKYNHNKFERKYKNDSHFNDNHSGFGQRKLNTYHKKKTLKIYKRRHIKGLCKLRFCFRINKGAGLKFNDFASDAFVAIPYWSKEDPIAINEFHTIQNELKKKLAKKLNVNESFIVPVTLNQYLNSIDKTNCIFKDLEENELA